MWVESFIHISTWKRGFKIKHSLEYINKMRTKGKTKIRMDGVSCLVFLRALRLCRVRFQCPYEEEGHSAWIHSVVTVLAWANGTRMQVSVWSFAGSFESSGDENLVLCALMPMSIKDNPCESHIGTNLSLRNLYCIDRSCKFGVCVFKAPSLLTEGAVNELLCERVGLSRVRQVWKEAKMVESDSEEGEEKEKRWHLRGEEVGPSPEPDVQA